MTCSSHPAPSGPIGSGRPGRRTRSFWKRVCTSLFLQACTSGTNGAGRGFTLPALSSGGVAKMYPKPGQMVRAEISWGKVKKVVEERFTGKVFRARSGAVLGVLETHDGKREYIPWTSDTQIVKFSLV